MKIVLILKLIVILFTLSFYSYGKGCLEQKDSLGNYWTKGQSRTQGGGWIWFRGIAQSASYDLAYKFAETRALDNLLKECQVIPKSAKFFERCNDSQTKLTKAYARVAIEKKYCNIKAGVNHRLTKLYKRYIKKIQQMEEEYSECNRKTPTGCLGEGQDLLTVGDVNDAYKVFSKGCRWGNPSSCENAAYLYESFSYKKDPKSLISRHSKLEGLYKNACKGGLRTNNCYKSLVNKIAVESFRLDIKNIHDDQKIKELMPLIKYVKSEFKYLCLNENDHLSCVALADTILKENKNEGLSFIKKNCIKWGGNSCWNYYNLSRALYNGKRLKSIKGHAAQINMYKDVFKSSCSKDDPRTCFEYYYHSYRAKKISKKKYLNNTYNICNKLVTGFDPYKTSKKEIMNVCRFHDDEQRALTGKFKGKSLKLACDRGDKKSCASIKDIKSCIKTKRIDSSCNWTKLVPQKDLDLGWEIVQ